MAVLNLLVLAWSAAVGSVVGLEYKSKDILKVWKINCYHQCQIKAHVSVSENVFMAAMHWELVYMPFSAWMWLVWLAYWFTPYPSIKIIIIIIIIIKEAQEANAVASRIHSIFGCGCILVALYCNCTCTVIVVVITGSVLAYLSNHTNCRSTKHKLHHLDQHTPTSD